MAAPRLAFALAVLSLPTSAWAWGEKGHQVVALIAEAELTQAAREQVRTLLGGDPRDTMPAAAMWPDETRARWPETKPYHFVDIPVAQATSGFDRARDCPNGDCIVAAIERFTAVLGGKAPRARKREALSYLIHLVGDIHQPLHCAGRGDRGGNGVRVLLDGRLTNLHSVWDTAVVEALGGDAVSLAHRLRDEISGEDRSLWSAGEASDWATESFGVASEQAYGGLPEQPSAVPPSYQRGATATAAQQLKKAAVRLSKVLNETLGLAR